jgi:peptidoglycan/LPS O-acetylase OafA/YrhL
MAKAVDSLTLTVSEEKPGVLDHITGIRTLAIVWVVVAHYAKACAPEEDSCDPTTLMNHAHVGICAASISSGFSMYWNHGRFSFAPALASADSVLGKAFACVVAWLWWIVSKLHRVMICSASGMYFALFVTKWIEGAGATYWFFGLTFGFYFHQWANWGQTDGGFPYPNGSMWYIAAIFWSWVLFPLVVPFVRALTRPPCGPRGWPIALLLPVMAFVSYIPVLGLISELDLTYHNGMWIHNGSLSGSWGNVIQDSPESQMPDFFCGVGVAALAKIYKPVFDKWIGAQEPMRKFGVKLLLGLVSDGLIAIVFHIIITPDGTYGDDVDYWFKRVSCYHTATLPLSLFLLLCTLSDGAGITGQILRWKPLVDLGRYGLYIYVFQSPSASLYNDIFDPDSTGRAQLNGDAFLFFFVSLTAFSAVYAEYIEETFCQVVYWAGALIEEKGIPKLRALLKG